jgi:hypothetical protein
MSGRRPPHGRYAFPSRSSGATVGSVGGVSSTGWVLTQVDKVKEASKRTGNKRRKRSSCYIEVKISGTGDTGIE